MGVPLLLFRPTKGAVRVIGIAPQYDNGEIGDVNTTTIEVTFSEDIVSPTNDYKGGVTIKVNAAAQVINTATRQVNKALVYYVIAAVADVNDVVTWEYDDNFGDIEDDDEGNPLTDVAAQTQINYIGCHLYFDTPDDAIWIGIV